MTDWTKDRHAAARKACEEICRWAGHAEECRTHDDGPDTCDCGSDAAVAAARTDLPAALDLVAAYDAERAHHARTTQTLCTERAALTIERARVAKIAAILSDDTLEHPQKIGRALRVAEGAS